MKKAFILPIIIFSIITTTSVAVTYFIVKNKIFKNLNNNSTKQEKINKEEYFLNETKKELNNIKNQEEKKDSFIKEKNNKDKIDNIYQDLFPTLSLSPTKIKTQNNYSDYPRPGEFVFINNELQVSASKENNGIKLNWSKCNSDQFVAYKIARSENASDVYFPRDGAIASISNQEILSFLDTNVENGKNYYYRICSLEKNGESWCGNIIKISF
ncbi:MAG: hypothetical protein N2593_02565 [Patescibacteria group bacterium]|nr:hypothetical protein [Patescibacteria group bacterium]